MKELLGTPVHDGCIAETNCRCFGHRSTVTRIYVFRGVRSSYRLSRAILRATIVPIETRITRTTCTHTHADGPPSSCTRAQVPSVVKLMEVGFSSDTLSLTSAIDPRYATSNWPYTLTRQTCFFSSKVSVEWDQWNRVRRKDDSFFLFCFVYFGQGVGGPDGRRNVAYMIKFLNSFITFWELG